jgi:hypothetical protein
MTITPSSTGGLAVNVGMSAYTYAYPSSTPSMTPSVTATNDRLIGGSLNYEMMSRVFSFKGVRVLVDCNTNEEVYTTQDLILSGVPIKVGDIIRTSNNGVQRCFTYDRNESTGSSNISIQTILNVYTGTTCSSCAITPTPTPTMTMTPSVTITPSITLTPSPTSNLLHVFESCIPLDGNTINSQLIQNIGIGIPIGFVIKDSDNNCWTYLGAFDKSYTPVGNINYFTYTGNYFDTNGGTFIDCVNCLNNLS